MPNGSWAHRYQMTCHECGHTWTASIPASWHAVKKDSHTDVSFEKLPEPIMPDGSDYHTWVNGDPDTRDNANHKPRGGARKLMSAFTAGARSDPTPDDHGYGGDTTTVRRHPRRVPTGGTTTVRQHSRRRG